MDISHTTKHALVVFTVNEIIACTNGYRENKSISIQLAWSMGIKYPLRIYIISIDMFIVAYCVLLLPERF